MSLVYRRIASPVSGSYSLFPGSPLSSSSSSCLANIARGLSLSLSYIGLLCRVCHLLGLDCWSVGSCQSSRLGIKHHRSTSNDQPSSPYHQPRTNSLSPHLPSRIFASDPHRLLINLLALDLFFLPDDPPATVVVAAPVVVVGTKLHRIPFLKQGGHFLGGLGVAFWMRFEVR